MLTNLEELFVPPFGQAKGEYFGVMSHLLDVK